MDNPPSDKDVSPRPQAPARQNRPEKKGGKVMDAMRSQFMSLRGRTEEEGTMMDLPALQAERDRLTRKMEEEKSAKKLTQIEESLGQINARIDKMQSQTKSPIESPVTSPNTGRRNSARETERTAEEARERSKDKDREKEKFSLRKPLMDFFAKTKRLGKKSSSAPASPHPNLLSHVSVNESVTGPPTPITPHETHGDEKKSPELGKSHSKSSHNSSAHSTIKTSTAGSNNSSPKSTSKFMSLRGQRGKNVEEEELSKMFAKFNSGQTLGRKGGKSKLAAIETPGQPAGRTSSFGLNKEDALEILRSLDMGETELPAGDFALDTTTVAADEPDKYGTVNARRVNIMNFFASPATSAAPSPAEDRSTAVHVPSGVVTEYAVKTELNPGGLKRAKKDKKEMVIDGKKKMLYQNEDENICLCPFEGDSSQAFFAVYDGHAGRNAAVAAREIMHERFHKRLQGVSKPYRDLKEVLHDTFLEVDKEMVPYEHEGCTATTVFCWTDSNGDRFLQAANVGDSTAVLCRKGQAISLGFDHKLKDNPTEVDRLKAMGVEINQGQSRLHGMAITRTLGDHCFKKVGEESGIIAEPFVSSVLPIQHGDVLIVASDGLWDVMTLEKAAEMVEGMGSCSTSDMVRKLLNTAVGNHECRDNVTVICTRL